MENYKPALTSINYYEWDNTDLKDLQYLESSDFESRIGVGVNFVLSGIHLIKTASDGEQVPFYIYVVSYYQSNDELKVLKTMKLNVEKDNKSQAKGLSFQAFELNKNKKNGKYSDFVSFYYGLKIFLSFEEIVYEKELVDRIINNVNLIYDSKYPYITNDYDKWSCEGE